MHEVNLSVKFNFYTCLTCGVIYCIPAELDKERQKDGEDIFCCNGHTCSYPGDKDDEGEEWKKGTASAPDIEQRRQKILELHNAEQAEAKAAEAKEKAPCNGLEELGRQQGEDKANSPLVRQYGRMLCPHCDHSYKSRLCLGKHLRSVHKLTNVEAHAIAYAPVREVKAGERLNGKGGGQ